MFLLVPAYPGSPGSKAVKRLCVCVCSTYAGTPFEGGVVDDDDDDSMLRRLRRNAVVDHHES